MKHLIFGLPLTLALVTACDLVNSPSNATQPTMISGTIPGYTGGTASIDLKDNANANFSSNATIASGSVNSSGAFTLVLPSATTVGPYLSATKESDLFPTAGLTCTGSFTNSNPASKTFGTGSLYVGTTQYTTLQTSYNSANLTGTGSAYLWFYTDQATTLGGTKTCTATNSKGVTSTTTVTYTAPLKVGWNLVQQVASATGDATRNTVSAQVTFTTVNDQATTWQVRTAAQALGLKSEPDVVDHAFRLN